MVLPEEEWFCVTTFNNLMLQHDLERGNQTETGTENMMMGDGMMGR